MKRGGAAAGRRREVSKGRAGKYLASQETRSDCSHLSTSALPRRDPSARSLCLVVIYPTVYPLFSQFPKCFFACFFVVPHCRVPGVWHVGRGGGFATS